MATFEQKCISGPNDQKSVLTKLEYVVHVEEIMELNYGGVQHSCLVVQLGENKLH